MASTITVEFVGDLSKLRKSFEQVESRAERVKGRLSKVGTALTLGFTVPIAGAAVAAGKMASDIQEMEDRTRDVFRGSADEVIAWSDTLLDKFGVGADEALDFANVVGNSMIAAGIPMRDVLDVQDEAVKRIGDLASATNASSDEIVDAYAAMQRGEYDPLERFVPGIRASTVEQKALSLGLADTSGELDDQDRLLAAHALFMEKSANAAGNFARTSDGAANQQKLLREQVEKLGREFGENLLPIAQRVLAWANSLAERFGNLTEQQQTTILAVAGLVAALGPLLKIAASAITVVQGLSKALVFLAANPVVLVIAGLVALVAALVFAYKRSEKFRDIVDGVFRAVAKVVGAVVETVVGWLKQFVGWLKRTWEDNEELRRLVAKAFKAIAETVVDRVKTAIAIIVAFVEAFKVARDRISDIRKRIGELFSALRDRIRDAVNSARDIVKGRIDRIVEFFRDLPSRAVDALSNLGSRLKTAISDAMSGIEINLPFGLSIGGSEGDGPGRAVGGSALARVRAAMRGIPGLAVTSTYRSPAHNARIGGAPRSFHMDSSNPAVDIGGPKSSLDRLYAVLRRMGGWRELIWQAPGHYDHVHAAEAGALVTRPTMLLAGESARARRGGGELVSPVATMRETFVDAQAPLVAAVAENTRTLRRVLRAVEAGHVISIDGRVVADTVARRLAVP